MAEETTFEKFAREERAKLGKERTKLVDGRATIDKQIARVDRELAAIAAYERTLAGTKKTGTRAPRSGGRRDSILKLITDSPAGMSRADILEGLGLKGNKSGEQSVSNALNNLKKQGKLAQKDGKYVAA